MGFRRWDFLGLLGDVGNDVSALLRLLETGEGHFGSGHELFGVLEVDVKDLGGPDDARLGVGLGVGESLNGARLTPDEAEEVGADALAAPSAMVWHWAARPLKSLRPLTLSPGVIVKIQILRPLVSAAIHVLQSTTENGKLLEHVDYNWMPNVLGVNPSGALEPAIDSPK